MTDQAVAVSGMLGHNRNPFGGDYDGPEAPAGEEDELETRVYTYEFMRDNPLGVERGEIEAVDPADAARLLRVRYLVSELPAGTRIAEKMDDPEDRQWSMSAKLRFLLRIMVSHHNWLTGHGGERADLSSLDLRGVNLAKRNLSHADLNDTDLSNADLSNAVLIGSNLRGANLEGANLCGADLSGVDLTDANLCDALMIGAKLDGADLWRANVTGCFIAPRKLHKALRCRLARREKKS